MPRTQTTQRENEGHKPAAPKNKLPSRKAALVAALSKRKAPTVAGLSEALGLQPHSVRAAISGLRKAGFAIETIKPAAGGAATYRIVKPAEPTAPSAGGEA